MREMNQADARPDPPMVKLKSKMSSGTHWPAAPLLCFGKIGEGKNQLPGKMQARTEMGLHETEAILHPHVARCEGPGRRTQREMKTTGERIEGKSKPVSDPLEDPNQNGKNNSTHEIQN
jgi:hypothetical protein